jgi:ParB family chromosome partitioning protein
MRRSVKETRISSPSRGVAWIVPNGQDTTSSYFPTSASSACTDPSCHQAKVDAHLAKAIAAKPKLVQISTAYCKPEEGSSVLPRSQYVAIQEEKPKDKDEAKRPQFKTCKFTTEAIIADGQGKGEIHKVCANPDCPIHHQKKQPSKPDASFKAQQEKERREAAIANTTGIRILAAITAAVPVRLMKRDLLFVTERLAAVLDENRLTVWSASTASTLPLMLSARHLMPCAAVLL